MGANAAQIARLRRMVDDSDSDYTSSELADYLERYPVVDQSGYESDDDDWTDTYNVYLAAADICDEKAAAVTDDVDFMADGAQFGLGQKQRAWLRMAERYRGRADEVLACFPE